VSVSMKAETRSIPPPGLKLLRPPLDGGCSRSTDQPEIRKKHCHFSLDAKSLSHS